MITGNHYDKDFVMRFMNPANDFSHTLLTHLRSKGYKKLAIVKTELAYLNHLIAGLQKELAQTKHSRLSIHTNLRNRTLNPAY